MRYFYFFLIVSLVACTSPKDDEITIRGEAFGTTYAVKYFGQEGDAENIQRGIDSIVTAVNKSMSTYIKQSDISKINRGDSTVVIDDMFLDVFMLSGDIHKTTSGYFDPTVGILRNAYGFGDTLALNDLSEGTVDSLMQYVGWNKVNLKKDRTISKKYPEIYFDFNAVAKGYGIDRIASFLDGRKLENFLIELGGEISASGVNLSSKNAWAVGVEGVDSQRDDRYATAVVSLFNKSMASSGNYRKNRVDLVTGKEYVHTINPLTGSAEKSDVLGATVIADNCAVADAWATAFMAMGLERSKEILGREEGIEAYLVYSDGVFMTEGFKSLLK